MQVNPDVENSQNIRLPVATSRKEAQDRTVAWWEVYLKASRKSSLSSLEIFLFGIMIAIGAQSSGWNSAYSGGFWTAFSCVLVTGIGYLCLCLCLAEMTSALPFSGGIYGMVRATAGPFAGYLVACFELLMNITYVTAGFHSFKTLLGADQSPTVLIICYCGVLLLCLFGGKVFWSIANVCTIAAVLLLMIYCFGSLHDLDLHSYGGLSESLTIYHFVKYLERSSTQYMGIQYLPLLCSLCDDPRKKMPKIMIAAPIVCLISALFLVVTVAGHAPGFETLSTDEFPLSTNYKSMLGVNTATAKWLNFPGLFAALFGFLYCYGRQLQSISSTGLLPAIFQRTIPHLNTPYYALILGTLFSIILGTIGVYYPILLSKLFHVSTISTNVVFLGACGSYLLFKKNFGQLQRSFENPLGVSSAVIGILIFALNIISACFFQGTQTYAALIVIVCFLVVAVLFYVFYMGKNQTFSDEEKQQMFKAYLLNANKAKRERLRNRQQQQLQTNSGSGLPRKGNTKNNSVAPLDTSQNQAIDAQMDTPSETVGSPTSLKAKEENTSVEGSDPCNIVDESKLETEVENLADTVGNLLSATGPERSSTSQRSYRAPFRLPFSFSNTVQVEENDAHQAGGVSGKSMISGKSMKSTASKLTEYQELAIMASGGLLASLNSNEDGHAADDDPEELV